MTEILGTVEYRITIQKLLHPVMFSVPRRRNGTSTISSVEHLVETNNMMNIQMNMSSNFK
jgi:hypothetical protein